MTLSERLLLSSRIGISALLAILATVALLYLMTVLVSPDKFGDTFIVPIDAFVVSSDTRVAYDTEPDTTPYVEDVLLPIRPSRFRRNGSGSAPIPTLKKEGLANRVDRRDETRPTIDWRQELDRVLIESRKDRIKQWRIDNGYEKYTSIMQGSPPTSPFPETVESSNAYVGEGYKNTYGDTVIRISKNCVLQRFNILGEHSDFSRRLPGTVFCESPKNRELAIEDWIKQRK